jgi:hypothetical protein
MYLALAVKVEMLLRSPTPERRFLVPFWNCISISIFFLLVAIWYAFRQNPRAVEAPQP